MVFYRLGSIAAALAAMGYRSHELRLEAAEKLHSKNANDLARRPTTDQPTRNESGITEQGSRVQAKPNADEQNKKWNIFDDDDDFTGGSGASDETPVALGDVDPEFDAYIPVGGVLVVISVLALLYSANRSRSQSVPV